MPRVSQNHDGSPKRRLQPILILDEPLGQVDSQYTLATPRVTTLRERGITEWYYFPAQTAKHWKENCTGA